MVEFEVVMDKLLNFETADEIADYLKYYGIKAVPHSVRSCAITQFVEAETGLKGQIITNSIRVKQVINNILYNSTVIKTNKNSAAMKEFVQKFDTEKYPDLIADPYNLRG